jgi:1-deoxyxylulose-5-phosphate synthase
MDFVRLGKTELKISRLALGCMSYGDPTTPNAHTWALKEDDAQPYFRQAVELGVIFWDTANTYQLGPSEEVVGRAVKCWPVPSSPHPSSERPSPITCQKQSQHSTCT